MLDNQEVWLAHSLENLNKIAKELWKKSKCDIWLFSGDLGAGKTSLIKALVKTKNDKIDVSSPSYSLVNEYPIGQAVIFHMDLYRLKDTEELLNIGFEEYLYRGGYVFIEWPEIAMSLIPESYHTIKIELMDNEDRKIIFR